jgi:glycosyltransferase involved in cell wall biosynthesis
VPARLDFKSSSPSAPGAADVIKDGGGYLTEATDEGFAQGILRVLEDEGQLSKLRQEAPAVAERYSIDAMTSLMIEVYEHVVRSRA